MGEMAVEFKPPTRPITVDDFQKMCESGILKPDERVELVDGELFAIPSMNAPHAGTVARMMHVLNAQLRDRALVWSQLPLVVSERSEPFPDITLLRLRDNYYCDRLPAGDDQFAVIEISDTMLLFDRGAKLRMYAKAGIADYWIVDVNGKTVEICRDPHELGYGSRTVTTKGESVSFAAFPDVVFTVDELLG
jgi:Uma2 family endonuclease